jgi:hypothetical protein
LLKFEGYRADGKWSAEAFGPDRQPFALSLSFMMRDRPLPFLTWGRAAVCLLASPLSVIALTDSEIVLSQISLKVSDSPDELFSVKGRPASSYSVSMEYSTA